MRKKEGRHLNELDSALLQKRAIDYISVGKIFLRETQAPTALQVQDSDKSFQDRPPSAVELLYHFPVTSSFVQDGTHWKPTAELRSLNRHALNAAEVRDQKRRNQQHSRRRMASVRRVQEIGVAPSTTMVTH